ncbi:hypothetical protein HDA45_005553 [Amycolatopsis umgeniensis]|uniref:Uncharacterized protein n=1 Tax=Amycolatopsis umgeniensis TaxID=336628 RepID=A0A841B5W1_9PSEU|nr:hypothetical protein [Amycolatopsis umgeniensis]
MSIARRRSTRSVSTPACRANTSHGRDDTVASPAMSAGDRVYWTATRPSATLTIPSARFDSPDELHSRQ